MNPPAKRCRQLNIKEYFTPTKRGRREDPTAYEMADQSSQERASETGKSQMRELLASAAEKRIASIASRSDVNKEDTDGLPVSGESESDQLSELLNNSEELFTDLSPMEDDACCKPVPSTGEDMQILSLNHLPKCAKTLPPLQPNEKHTILFRPHILPGCAPRPFPDDYRDRWDSNHVRMPCSSLNKYHMENGVQSRWDVICTALSGSIKSSTDLENAIMSYNKQYLGFWNFHALHAFINQHLDSDHRLVFFEFILPGMVDLALDLPRICTKPIPLLKKHTDHAVTISQRQIACLLANAFFCTFPRRNHHSMCWGVKNGGEYSNYPDINFNRLYLGTKNESSESHHAKLECILNYFTNILQEEPTGAVTFHRQHVQQLPDWSNCTKPIREVLVRSKGLIEDQGQGMLQIDFANRYVGGGVLGRGCVQEEIRFVISPELLVSRLFTECLAETEALIVTGVQQFSKYKGYGNTFKFDGNYQDRTQSDGWGRRYTQVVAIDALHFGRSCEQFKIALIKRELNKAYAGFYERETASQHLAAIATGNWGCGAFNGSPYLKFLIQLMAAAATDRDVLYFSFGNEQLEGDLHKMYNFIKSEKMTVGDLWTLLEVYCNSAMQTPEKSRPKLYDYIYSTNLSCESEKEKAGEPSSPSQSDTKPVWPKFM